MSVYSKPVKFITAKLLKEVGFQTPTSAYYFEENGEFKQNKLTGTNGYYGEEYSFEQDEFLENWNDGGVTKKNGQRCWGCDKSNIYFETCSAPSIGEVIDWIYSKLNIWISVTTLRDHKWHFNYKNTTNQDPLNYVKDSGFNYPSPESAYEAAFEYILNKTKTCTTNQ